MSVASGLWATVQRQGNPTNRSPRMWQYGLFFEGATVLRASMFYPDNKRTPTAPCIWDCLFDTYGSPEDAKAAAIELKLPWGLRVEIIDLHFWAPTGIYSAGTI